ncbi:MAG TPA: outer membrane beta-barrel protein [Salegentibacter sp.]|nr:outer membrane beta-barrel protein [Salegentibacter sp.]
MKKLIIIAVFLAGTSLMAQETEFGIKGGLNYGASGDYENVNEGAEDFRSSFEEGENKTGFHVGAYSKFGILGFFLQPEVMYTSLTTQYESFDYKLNKIDAPVLVGANIFGPLSIKAGPSFQYILNNELEETSFEIGEVENDITIGYQLGAGLNFGRLGFDLRYENAFSENTAFVETASERFSLDSRPSQWILSASYSF